MSKFRVEGRCRAHTPSLAWSIRCAVWLVRVFGRCPFCGQPPVRALFVVNVWRPNMMQNLRREIEIRKAQPSRERTDHIAYLIVRSSAVRHFLTARPSSTVRDLLKAMVPKAPIRSDPRKELRTPGYTIIRSSYKADSMGQVWCKGCRSSIVRQQRSWRVFLYHCLRKNGFASLRNTTVDPRSAIEML
jgi:hypothetical protein